MSAIKKLPENVVESLYAYYWQDNNGIISVIYKPQLHHDQTDAVSCIAEAVNMNGGTMPRLLLIDLTDIKSMTREAREEYKKASAAPQVLAIALITRSVGARILGNFFLSFNKAESPIKLFKSYKAAHEWLLTHADKQ